MSKAQIKKDVKRIRNAVWEEIKNAKNFSDKIEIIQSSYKLYDEIYEKYGQEAYCRYVPRKCRERDVSDLLDEKRYISVLNKHGQKMFNCYLSYITANDMEYEGADNKKINSFLFKRRLYKVVLPSVMSMLVSVCYGVQLSTDMILKKEEIAHAHQIETYLNKIEEYGNKVSKLNLSDIQNIMIATSDMWGHIDGYGEPKIDLLSYPGLDLATEDGLGVCRNMADDVARKLNAINPKYNARVIIVYMDDGDMVMADIKRKDFDKEKEQTNIPATEDCSYKEETNATEDCYNVEETNIMYDEEQNNTEPSEENDSNDIIIEWLNKHEEDLCYYTGNHAVVMLDSIEDNIELIVDPTNPSIGMAANGGIVMFNGYGLNPCNVRYIPTIAFTYGTKKALEVPKNIFETTRVYSNCQIQYYKSKYGVDAQNRAIEQAKIHRVKNYIESLKLGHYDISNQPHESEKNDICESGIDYDER